VSSYGARPHGSAHRLSGRTPGEHHVRERDQCLGACGRGRRFRGTALLSFPHESCVRTRGRLNWAAGSDMSSVAIIANEGNGSARIGRYEAGRGAGNVRHALHRTPRRVVRVFRTRGRQRRATNDRWSAHRGAWGRDARIKERGRGESRCADETDSRSARPLGAGHLPRADPGERHRAVPTCSGTRALPGALPTHASSRDHRLARATSAGHRSRTCEVKPAPYRRRRHRLRRALGERLVAAPLAQSALLFSALCDSAWPAGCRSAPSGAWRQAWTPPGCD
jgi:hypothetical protein